MGRGEPNRWTVMAAVVLAVLFVGLVNTVWFHNVSAVVGFALMLLAGWWLLVGCARRGSRLAQRITNVRWIEGHPRRG